MLIFMFSHVICHLHYWPIKPLECTGSWQFFVKSRFQVLLVCSLQTGADFPTKQVWLVGVYGHRVNYHHPHDSQMDTFL